MTVPSTRRAALGAILAAPMTGGDVMALPSGSPQHGAPVDVPDHEARFLALPPQLRQLLPPLEKAKDVSRGIYQSGEDHTGPHPGHSDLAARKAWVERARLERERLGYHEAYEAWNDRAHVVDKLVGDFMDERMTTLRAIAWKARMADVLDCWEEAAGSDLAAWAREDASCA